MKFFSTTSTWYRFGSLDFERAIKGKNIFLGDRNHIHHLLNKKIYFILYKFNSYNNFGIPNYTFFIHQFKFLYNFFNIYIILYFYNFNF